MDVFVIFFLGKIGFGGKKGGQAGVKDGGLDEKRGYGGVKDRGLDEKRGLVGGGCF